MLVHKIKIRNVKFKIAAGVCVMLLMSVSALAQQTLDSLIAVAVRINPEIRTSSRCTLMREAVIRMRYE